MLARELGLMGGGAAAGTASRWRPPPLTVSTKQFGQHGEQLGVKFGEPNTRDKFRAIIDAVYQNPDEVRQGPWRTLENSCRYSPMPRTTNGP
jgi:hypothetical protein